MPTTGYLQMPTIAGDTIVFVTEDDLWSVDARGGLARRLTATASSVSFPALSPDGRWLAFTSQDEMHPEVWCMPAAGGPARRLTWLGTNTVVRGFAPDGRIAFVTDAGQAFAGVTHAHLIAPEGGPSELVPLGPATYIAWAPTGAVVVGRGTPDPATWKRYRGGRAGTLWVDTRGRGSFKPAPQLPGNVVCPMWVDGRLAFVSDHEGIANVYSCKPNGTDVRRHTDHDEYFVRNARTDGTRIVYQHAAEIWTVTIGGDARRVDIELASPRTQRNRKFVDAARHLGGYAVHPEGHSVLVETRGKLFTMPLWEQSVRQRGQADGVRYRHSTWIGDGTAIVTVSDEGGDDRLEVHDDVSGDARVVATGDLGCITGVATPPAGRTVVVTNHRGELLLVDTDTGETRVADHSPVARLGSAVWSPDSRWVAYECWQTPKASVIKLCEIASGATHAVTSGEFRDFAPSFDAGGRYLYFLSARVFDPVYDMLYFDLGFPKGVRPYAIMLRAGDPSPFIAAPRGLGAPSPPAGDDKGADGSADPPRAKPAAKSGKKARATVALPPALRIDVDGMAGRVTAFPMPEGRYEKVVGIAGKVLFINHPVAGSLGHDFGSIEPDASGVLEVFDLAELKHDTLIPSGVTDIEVARDGTTAVVQSARRLRAVKAGEKPPEGKDAEGPGRASGWLDLGRIKVSVDPGSEWDQMYLEAWRLQRDHFWVADMSGVDWARIRDRYRPLIARVASRKEFSDLVWEMQGELGTSHAYEVGGDYRPPPAYALGHLGAQFAFDGRRWRVESIVAGDPWDPGATSPLTAPGVGVQVGDTVLAINGLPLDATTPPAARLVNQAGQTVALTIGDARGRTPRTVMVTALPEEFTARYRAWVSANRARVHDATGGRVGYVHVPDMGPSGYAEFHRAYGPEVERDALIVDVRFNRGGHVSALVLEKLNRRRLGFAVPRWGAPEPYPEDSPSGPLVAITNANAGSDGDIFSHCFKLFGLGPLVGTRTWGGVIGISPTHVLVDGTLTTQPEYSFWFRDVGWGVENYGTDPDHVVEIRPQDHAAGRDPQLETAIDLATRALRTHKPLTADVVRRPNLALPRGLPRG